MILVDTCGWIEWFIEGALADSFAPYMADFPRREREQQDPEYETHWICTTHRQWKPLAEKSMRYRGSRSPSGEAKIYSGGGEVLEL